MQERRQTKRRLTSVFIRFRVGKNNKTDHRSFTRDMSLEGVRLLSSSRLKSDDYLEMNIDVPTNPDMTVAEGNVRWVGERPLLDENGELVFPAGVEITYMDRQDREFLEEFLAQQYSDA